MRKILFLLSFIPTLVYSQEKKDPFDFYAKYTGDYAVINTKNYIHYSVYLGNIDLIANFSTERANLWKGGTFSSYVINNHGMQPSANYACDLQVFSNIEAPERTKLFELWYEQYFGEKLSIKIGQQNINSEFVYSDNGLNFINSSFGTMPSVSYNIPISIFPNTGFGVRVIYHVNDKWLIQGAAFDGNPGDETTNKYGLKWNISKNNGLNLLGEIHYTLKRDDKETGKYKIGYWQHTAKFTGIADTTKQYNGNFGAYIIADQTIFSENEKDSQGLSVFVMLGVASKHRNMIHYGIAGGLCYYGIFNGRDEDILGIGITNATINPDFAKGNNLSVSENTIEFMYSAKIHEHICFQPDIQYIINPSCSETQNPLIALMRFAIEF